MEDMNEKKCDNCSCCTGDCNCNHHYEMSKEMIEKKKEFLAAKIKHLDGMLKKMESGKTSEKR